MKRIDINPTLNDNYNVMIKVIALNENHRIMKITILRLWFQTHSAEVQTHLNSFKECEHEREREGLLKYGRSYSEAP